MFPNCSVGQVCPNRAEPLVYWPLSCSTNKHQDPEFHWRSSSELILLAEGQDASRIDLHKQCLPRKEPCPTFVFAFPSWVHLSDHQNSRSPVTTSVSTNEGPEINQIFFFHKTTLLFFSFTSREQRSILLYNDYGSLVLQWGVRQ